MFLDEPGSVASILENLLESKDKDGALMAFQVAFDLFENEYWAFLLKVRDQLPESKTYSSNIPSSSQSSLPTRVESNGLNAPDIGSIASPDTYVAMDTSEDVHMEDNSMVETVSNGKTNLTDIKESAYTEKLLKIKRILSGEKPIQLTLQFIYSHNRADCVAEFSAAH